MKPSVVCLDDYFLELQPFKAGDRGLGLEFLIPFSFEQRSGRKTLNNFKFWHSHVSSTEWNGERASS